VHRSLVLLFITKDIGRAYGVSEGIVRWDGTLNWERQASLEGCLITVWFPPLIISVPCIVQIFKRSYLKSTHKGVQGTESPAPLYEWISGVITGDLL
jgi:hypothetical protein